MASYKPVEAVLRGLEVLRVVNRSGPATVRAIHQETGLDKSTIIRMLETLIHAGYVTVASNGGGYGVTGRVLQLSTGFVRYDKAAEICAPILSNFRQNYGWPSDFAIRDDDAMIVVRTSRETGPFNFNRNPGFRAPIMLTSIGKAYLAFCDDVEANEILDRLAETVPHLPSRARIERAMAKVRAAGYAVMDDGYSQREYKGTIWAMAVPVQDHARLYGALNMMFLKQTVSPDIATERYLAPLQAAAAEMAEALGRDEI
ncbi:IclR family transcriptional regulator domain-containing protein [Mesorhizobium escarrei]|uniref:DNA-binding transcriptional activator MhpR n=1 Tax=Mesorhizobium escarrei TaxID=666018 RepID=A0ABM9E661_9HYPH|nr:helix-turn-helix domain-containing protein [Mesorhizobium escarrei]CAH2404606.1 putative DNA-binding transcriptional activator MhpR [Mesorhizobium escarrei]